WAGWEAWGGEGAAVAAGGGRLGGEGARREERLREKQEELIAAETDRRRLELDREEAELRLEADLLRRQWAEACAALGEAAPKAELPAPGPAAAGRAAWLAALTEEEARGGLAARWAECLEEAAGTFPARLAG